MNTLRKYDGYRTNKATLPAAETRHIRISHRREDHFYAQYSVLNPKTRKELATLRLYATQGLHSACFWLHAEPYANGSAKAGGYGYHRASQAASDAIEDAGIKLAYQHFGGMGDGAIETALEAVGRACGCRKPWIIKAHA